jgi:hypothetical protein
MTIENLSIPQQSKRLFVSTLSFRFGLVAFVKLNNYAIGAFDTHKFHFCLFFSFLLFLFAGSNVAFFSENVRNNHKHDHNHIHNTHELTEYNEKYNRDENKIITKIFR